MIDATTFKLAEETQWIIFGILAFAWILLSKFRWVAWTALWFVGTLIIRAFANVPPEHDPMLLPAGHGIPTGWVINIVLYFDLAFIGLLVLKTGGSEISPFTPLYFILPTFALLILGDGWEVYYFAGAAFVVFAMSLFLAGEELHIRWVPGDFADPRYVWRARRTSLFVSAACLFWVMLIDVRKPYIEAEMARRRAPTVETAEPQSALPTAVPFPSATVTPHKTRTPPRSPKATPLPSIAPRLTATANPVEPSPPSVAPQPAVTARPTATATTSEQPTPTPRLPLSGQKVSPSRSYPVFLTRFYAKNLSGKKRAAYLRKMEKQQMKVNWEVKFRSYERRKKEIWIYFDRTDNVALPEVPPVQLAKLPMRYADLIEHLSPGAVIQIGGRLQRHSRSALFVQAEEIYAP